MDRSLVIIAGPWTGEVGFEVLYWIPLLRWCVERWPKLQDRLVVVSRGGVSGWYEGIADAYIDIGELYDAETLKRRLEKERKRRRALGRSEARQPEESDWDHEIAKLVARKLGLRRPALLHPSIAHQSKKIVWSLAESGGFARWRRPERGPLAAHLPDEYVAVSFQWNAFFKAEADAFADEAIRVLNERIPVVLLDPETQRDQDHADVPDGDGEAIRLAPHIRDFRDGLTVQATAIANATAFVGSVGGLSYVAPHYGVPSVCFWSVVRDPTKRGVWRDLELAQQAFNHPGWGCYTAGSCHEAPAEDLLLPVI